MGLQNQALNFLVERGGNLSKSLLCTKPQNSRNFRGIKYAKELDKDIVQFTHNKFDLIKKQAEALLKEVDQIIPPNYRKQCKEVGLTYDSIKSCCETNPEAFVTIFPKIGFKITEEQSNVLAQIFKKHSAKEIKSVIPEVDAFYKKLPPEAETIVVNGKCQEVFNTQVAEDYDYLNLLIMKMYNPKTYNYLLKEENPLRTEALLSSWDTFYSPHSTSFFKMITPTQLNAMKNNVLAPRELGLFVASSDKFYENPQDVKKFSEQLAKASFSTDVELYRGEKTVGMFDTIPLDKKLQNHLKELVESNKTKAQNLMVSRYTGLYQESANISLYDFIMQKENLSLADAMQIARFGSEQDIETILNLIKKSKIIDTRFKSLSFDKGMASGWKNHNTGNNATILHTANVKKGTQGIYHDTNNGQEEVILNNTAKKMTFRDVVYDKKSNTFYINTDIENTNNA